MIDIKKLTNAIAGENATGVNLREDKKLQTLYYQIKDARQEARSEERRFVQQLSESTGMEHWNKVYDLAIDILQNHSKDLEVCAWFIESLIRKFDFQGLNQGLQLVILLIEQFWGGLYPEPDEDGVEIKVAAFVGLNGIDSPGSLVRPITNIALTQGDTKGPFVLWQYKQALDVDRVTDIIKKNKKFEELGFSLTDIQQSVLESESEFYQDLELNINECLEALTKLSELFTTHCEEVAPPTSYIKNTLEDVKDHIRFLLADSPITMTKVDKQEDDKSENNDSNKIDSYKINSNEVNDLSATIQSRHHALKQLTLIASYFETAEPHSPIPFLLKRAVYWGGLTLPELFKELIDEDKERDKVFKLTGIAIEKSN